MLMMGIRGSLFLVGVYFFLMIFSTEPPHILQFFSVGESLSLPFPLPKYRQFLLWVLPVELIQNDLSASCC